MGVTWRQLWCAASIIAAGCAVKNSRPLEVPPPALAASGELRLFVDFDGGVEPGLVPLFIVNGSDQDSLLYECESDERYSNGLEVFEDGEWKRLKPELHLFCGLSFLPRVIHIPPGGFRRRVAAYPNRGLGGQRRVRFRFSDTVVSNEGMLRIGSRNRESGPDWSKEITWVREPKRP